MQPTKYPLETLHEPSGALLGGGCSSGIPLGDCASSDTCEATSGGHWGREAPIDLIEEHLTYNSPTPQYRRGCHGGVLLKNWFVPEDWEGPDGVKNNFMVKVQPFAKGGYEATVRSLDLVKVGDAIIREKKHGKREAPEEPSIENRLKCAARAKREMRYKVRNMMADHLVTFTKREAAGSVYWTPEEWGKAWDKFRRNLNRVLPDFPYVAILEQHAKGNYHLHVAWCGRVNVGIVRKLWLLAIGGGKGCGNIDSRKIKAPSGGDRSNRIARYISKYVGKHFETENRFNKKRYWASRQTLEEARRYVLTADTLDGAIKQMGALLGLDYAKFQVTWGGKVRNENLFLFPDGGGMWLNYIPELHGGDPPF